ncbi:MAG: hypothetical protein L0Y66_02320 [Myxococcaceae bacterium]|nr:hypothetical protein [Myxococcaceae bacterium]MCI0670312.1 hypothetical protein [Myxococcaceae bacterium]
MRALVLSLAAFAALAGCTRRLPAQAVSAPLAESEPARCELVAAVLREHAMREGRSLEHTEEGVEAVQVFVRAEGGEVLMRFFAEDPQCDVGPFRVVHTAEAEALTMVLTPAPDGFDWEIQRGMGPAVSEQPHPMGRLSRAGGTWVSTGTL